MKKKILIISHDASPGGAQNSILNLSKILKSLDYELYIILKKGGNLKEDFKKLGHCYFWNKIDISNSNNFIKILNKFINLNKVLNKILLNKILSASPELCICNTITNYEIIKNIINKNIKLVTWVHELAYMYDVIEKVSLEKPKETIKITDFFLCASKAVQDYLLDAHNIPTERTHILNEIINDKTLKIKKKKYGHFIIGGCGTLGWRKGSDLFLNVADILINKLKVEGVRFEWLGAQKNTISLLQFQHEIKQLGLEKFVKVILFEKNVESFMKSISLFLMSSREDPFPLVNLEAGLNKSPVLCFKGTGGSEEFAIADNIFTFKDTLSMAKRIKYYKENLLNLESDGEYSFLAASKFLRKSKTKEIESLVCKLLR